MKVSELVRTIDETYPLIAGNSSSNIGSLFWSTCIIAHDLNNMVHLGLGYLLAKNYHFICATHTIYATNLSLYTMTMLFWSKNWTATGFGGSPIPPG